MNANLLAISNIFVGTNCTGPVPAKAIKQSEGFSPPRTENTPVIKAYGTEKAEEAPVKGRHQLENEAPEKFSHAFRKEITAEIPQKAKNSRNVQKQNQFSNTDVEPIVIQPLLAQLSLRAELGPKGIAKKVEVKTEYGPEGAAKQLELKSDHGPEGVVKKAELKAEHGSKGIVKKVESKSGEIAQLRLNFRPETFPSPDEKTEKPDNNEPVPIISRNQSGPKAASPQAPTKPLITDTPSDKGENGKIVEMLNTSLRATRGPEDAQSPLEAHIGAENKIVTANGKPEAVPVSNAFGGEKTPPVAGKERVPEVLIGSDQRTNVNQQAADGEKPVVPDSQKVPGQNYNVLPAEDKPSGPQAVRVGSGEPAFIAEKAAYTGAEAGQPSHLGTQQTSGPLTDDVLGQGYNSPGNNAYQNLYRAQFQLFNGPINGRDGSASNNNSDSGFEQILSGNNVATYIAEQTSAFPEVVKIDNQWGQASPSDVSAGIAKQILESINSLPSQTTGNQQITVRLNPPELGRVFIKFEEQENQITGFLEVSKAETRYEIERVLPHIIQNLSDSGIQVKRLEVMLTDQSGQQSYKDQSLQDGSFQQHHDFSEGGDFDNPGAKPGIVGNNISYHNSLEAQVRITDNSINMLV